MAQTMRHARVRPLSRGFNNTFIRNVGRLTLSDMPQSRRGTGPTEDILAYSTGMMGRRF